MNSTKQFRHYFLYTINNINNKVLLWASSQSGVGHKKRYMGNIQGTGTMFENISRTELTRIISGAYDRHV
jgi:hypothetical protein